MQISPEFKNLIDLYRLLNRPKLVGEKFKCEIQCSVEIESLLRALWHSDKFDLVINTFETESRDEFPNEITNNLITIEVKLPQNERGKFYENLDYDQTVTLTIQKAPFHLCGRPSTGKADRVVRHARQYDPSADHGN